MPLRARIGAVMRNRITQNTVALYASQFLLTVVPLITLPWIARALGAAGLGEVVFVQSFGWVLAAIAEYGFRLSGTRAVARVRDEPERLAQTVAGVMGAKLLLCGAVTVFALVALVLVPRFREDPGLLVLGWLLGITQGLDPLWYFAGVERLRLTAAMEAAVRVLTAAAIIALVHDPGQSKLVLAIWAGGYAVSSFGLISVMYRAVPLRRPDFGAAVAALREGWSLFVNSAAITLYTAATVFLLGFVSTNAELAIFAAAERVVRAALRALSPVTSAAYPRVTYLIESGRTDRAQRLSAIALVALGGFGVVSGAAIFALAPFIVDVLFGSGFDDAVGVMRVLALLLPLAALAGALSGLWLLPRGFDRVFVRITVLAAIANVVLVLVVGSAAGAIGAAWVLVGIELGVAASLAIAIHRRRLFPTMAQARGRPAPDPS
jgi:PST family polysaccharide transporter